jgi:hypothetical protein
LHQGMTKQEIVTILGQEGKDLEAKVKGYPRMIWIGEEGEIIIWFRDCVVSGRYYEKNDEFITLASKPETLPEKLRRWLLP